MNVDTALIIIKISIVLALILLILAFIREFKLSKSIKLNQNNATVLSLEQKIDIILDEVKSSSKSGLISNIILFILGIVISVVLEKLKR